VSNPQVASAPPETVSHVCLDTPATFLTHAITYLSDHRIRITILINPVLIHTLFNEAAHAQQKLLCPAGFENRDIPLEFIKQQHYLSLISHLKEFLLKFCVLNYLFKAVRTEKLIIGGELTLDDIIIELDGTSSFSFVGTPVVAPIIQEWRYLPFRAPKRKNYKDLDRQVEHFIAEELRNLHMHVSTQIQENDWICIGLTRTDAHGTPLFADFTHYFWIQISDEKVENPLRDLLVTMHLGDTIITQNQGLQDYFSEQLTTNYSFKLEIISRIPHSYVCFEQIKNHFRLKTKKDLLKKLIEVFSYRNDISQRRAMAEECLALLLHKHPIEVPESVIASFQESLLKAMHASPDYNVYRTQKDFYMLVHSLAQKMAREAVLLDALAYHEKVPLERTDIENYLNCIKRPRTKEFIYARSTIPHHEGQSTLIPEEELMHTVVREKTINHVLYHLTKE